MAHRVAHLGVSGDQDDPSPGRASRCGRPHRRRTTRRPGSTREGLLWLLQLCRRDRLRGSDDGRRSPRRCRWGAGRLRRPPRLLKAEQLRRRRRHRRRGWPCAGRARQAVEAEHKGGHERQGDGLGLLVAGFGTALLPLEHSLEYQKKTPPRAPENIPPLPSLALSPAGGHARHHGPIRTARSIRTPRPPRPPQHPRTHPPPPPPPPSPPPPSPLLLFHPKEPQEGFRLGGWFAHLARDRVQEARTRRRRRLRGS